MQTLKTLEQIVFENAAERGHRGYRINNVPAKSSSTRKSPTRSTAATTRRGSAAA